MYPHVYIIAEAGVNHNGDLRLAKQLAEVAKEAGVDAVKYQTSIPTNVVSRYAEKAEYQKNNTGAQESQLEMILKLALTFDEFTELAAYCKEIGITFLSTPFDLESVDFLNEMSLPVWKIPSGEITNVPYLIQIARTGKPIIMSTGMSTEEEIEFALGLLKENGAGTVSLLHCNTEYPTPFEDVNLRAMLRLKERFHVSVGYSDHTPGIEVPIAAAALGAEIIEKHFTLDKNMEGPDHKASLEPQELRQMVVAIRNIEKAMGDGVKKPSKSEIKNMAIARKSIIAKRDIQKGEVFTEENITTKRPGDGISAAEWFHVLGQTAVADFKEDEKIHL